MNAEGTPTPQERVRARLKELGWSQAELARRSGITETTISNFLSGARTPRRPTLRVPFRALWSDEHALEPDEAMGQLLMYVDELAGDVVPAVVLEQEPTAEEREHLEKRGVRVASPGAWSGLTLEQRGEGQ